MRKMRKRWEKIVYKTKDYLETKYYNIKYGMYNLYKYIPVIWEGREWDHSYLYALMSIKMYNMALLHRNNSHLVRGEKTARELFHAARLALDIANDSPTFSIRRVDSLYKKYGRLTLKELMNNKKSSRPKWVDAAIKMHYNKSTKESIERAKELHRLMARKSLSWWD